MNLWDSMKFYNFYRLKNLKPGQVFSLLVLGITLIGSTLFFAGPAESSHIALTPLVFELTGEKGQTAGEYVRVMNPSYDETIVVRMQTEDIFPEGEEGRVRLQMPAEERDPFSLSAWVTFEPESFILEPREEKPIRFIVNIPEYAEPGGHYAAILASTELSDGPAGVGVGIVQRIASLVLLTVPGEMKEDLTIAGFETSKGYYDSGPIKFAVRFENRGTIHLRPQALITVTDIFGRQTAEIRLEAKNVIPGAVRRIETEWPEKWLWAGKYTAVLTGTYGSDDLDFPLQSITFWAFPWKAGLILLIILIFFILTRKRWLTALKILIKGERAFSPRKK